MTRARKRNRGNHALCGGDGATDRECDNRLKEAEGNEDVFCYRIRGTGVIVGVEVVPIGGKRADAGRGECVREDFGADSSHTDIERSHGQSGSRKDAARGSGNCATYREHYCNNGGKHPDPKRGHPRTQLWEILIVRTALTNVINGR